MEGCITIGDTKANLFIELLYWDDEKPVIGYSDKLTAHVPLMEKTIDILKRRGLDIVACICGSEKEELHGNGNMYFLFGGFADFNSLPDGFSANYLIAGHYLNTDDCLTAGNSIVNEGDNTPYTVLCPSDFNSDMTLSEMQDFFTQKALALHMWALYMTAKTYTVSLPNDKTDYFFDGEYLETTEESVYRYAPTQVYDKAVSYMEKYFGLPNSRESKDGRIRVPVLYFDNGTKFRFDDLEEAYYFIPFENPEEHSMLIVNSTCTLFAYGYNQKCFVADGYKVSIGKPSEWGEMD